ncbi:MAG: hypothetical protein Q9202_002311 [Teloschistes flavicans]
MILRSDKYSPNRAIDGQNLDKYISISFERFRLQSRTQASSSNSQENEFQPASAKESGDYIVRLLRTGICLNGVSYHFFGHSNSQLKSKTCFLYAGTAEEAARKVEALADFPKKSVAKSAKRVGLLFSAAKFAANLASDRCEDIADIRKDDYIFTDGCGLISPHFAKLLVQKTDIRFRNLRYTPAVFQIRYRGYKGVLTLHPELRGQILVKFRESMKKFGGYHDPAFSVVEYSKPYGFGFLNDEIVLLLNGLGIAEDTIAGKLREYLDFLASVPSDPRAAFRFFSYNDEPELAEKVLMDGIDTVKSTAQSRVSNEISKLLNKRGERRARILIPQSRLLFGVCDPFGVLKQVFVTWDRSLIPSKVAQAASYQGGKEPVSFKPVTHDDRLVYFAKFTNASLGRVKNLYLDWARLKGPMSAECQELNHLFSQCVDGNRIKVPKHLEDPPRPDPGKPPFVLDVLRDLATTQIPGHVSTDLTDLSYDRLQLLLSRDNVAFSEFELLQMTMRWCNKNDWSMEDLLEYFDFSKLSDEQKGWLVAQFPAKRYIPDLVMNGLLQSTILSKAELEYFKLNHHGLRWKKVFDSNLDRFGRFMEVMSSTIELFHRKFIVLRVTNRLTIGMYIPKPLLKHQECVVNETVRLFSFPHSQEDMVTYRRALPTLANYRLYFDDTGFQLYRTQRADTWIFINRPGTDDSTFRSIEDRGDKRRARHATVEAGINSDLIISIALGKFSSSLARHMGRVNRNPILGAEIYVISNRDANSMRVLDKWLEFIDTREVMPLFEKSEESYRLPDLKSVDWAVEPDYIRCIARDGNLALLDDLSGSASESSQIPESLPTAQSGRKRRSRRNGRKPSGESHAPTSQSPHTASLPSSSALHSTAQSADSSSSTFPQVSATNAEKLSKLFTWLLHHNQKARLHEVYQHLLKSIASSNPGNQSASILASMIAFLQQAPHLVVTFIELGMWEHLSPPVRSFLHRRSLDMLEAFCLAANEMQVFVVEPLRTFLSQMAYISISDFGSIVRQISLVIRSPETALDILMGVLELESSRLLVGRPTLIKYYVSNLIGIAMEHVDEARDSRAVRDDELQLKAEEKIGKVSARLRIDSHSRVRFAANDHVQLTAAAVPVNSLETRPYSMDVLVDRAEPGKVLFQCFHPVPAFVEMCAWKAKNCGSFVTSQAMYEALNTFVNYPKECCHIHDRLMGFSTPDNSPCLAETSEVVTTMGTGTGTRRDDLNESQNNALLAALDSPLTCLWGPPGTGKTHTVAVILEELLMDRERRLLVTAPTHNAVDNVMRKFLQNMQIRKTFSEETLRVSTDVRKVAEDLRRYTCDAMMGKDLNDDPSGRRKAQKRIKNCRLIFTTCIGAALGLLRTETFDTVIIDEASQQTEPQSLVPLTKGCFKAILVGDHVQLRATVQQHAQLVGFDVSMFERLYDSPDDETRFRKVMLDTQYRMHASICHFSSTEFYDNKLQTAVEDHDRPLLPREFPWPEPQAGKLERLFFVQCDATEDLGQKSKSNQGQAALCRQICKALLLQPPPSAAAASSSTSTIPRIAVLAPYARQVETLKDLQSTDLVVSSIDGFQGREAETVVFCTTRCNVHADIGFLKDLRRLNVMLTRARCACVVIGDRATLTGGDVDEKATGVWRRLVEVMTVMVV